MARAIVYRKPAPHDTPGRRAAAQRLSANREDPDALFAVAAFLASNGRLREAEGVLRELARIDPEYPGLWRFRAWVHAVLGHLWVSELCEARDHADG